MASLFELPADAYRGAVQLAQSVDELHELLDAERPESALPVAVSPTMRQVVRDAERFAASSAVALITGEPGTGKEVVARMLHERSPRAAQPYVRVNCAALAESLMESELFGHERGAFTGAEQARVGRIEWAGQGTLLLDEISEIPPRLQAKLLRVLEEEEYQRVGSCETRRVRARIVTTSNRRLEDEVAAGRFRSDLYYRLNVLQIEAPPLRERKEDIVPLAARFVRQFRGESPNGVERVSPAAVKKLCEHDWPGNVRELRNAIHRACVVSESDELQASDLPQWRSAADPARHCIPLAPTEPVPTTHSETQHAETENTRTANTHTANTHTANTHTANTGAAQGSITLAADATLSELERRAIDAALQRHGGNKAAAARQLGISPRTMFNKLHKYEQSLAKAG